MTLEEAEAKLVIDVNSLDEESAHRGQLLWEVSKEYMKAVERRDTAKHILELREAEISKEFRESSSEKITEAKAEQHVEMQPTYIEQRKFVIKYTAEVEGWNGMVKCFTERGKAIEDLCRLHLSGYYGTGISSPERRYIEARKAKES